MLPALHAKRCAILRQTGAGERRAACAQRRRMGMGESDEVASAAAASASEGYQYQRSTQNGKMEREGVAHAPEKGSLLLRPKATMFEF